MKKTTRRSQYALDALNFFMADIAGGVWPFLVIYLQTQLHWETGKIGLLMSIAGITGVLALTPAGGFVDRTRALRGLVAGAALAVGIGALAILVSDYFLAILGALALVGIAGALMGPALAALSIGIAGRANAERRFGRNQSMSSAGNVAAAALAGLIGWWLKPSAVFLLILGMSLVVAAAALLIRNKDIDYRVARGADGDSDEPQIGGLLVVFKNRKLLLFALCAVLFHFANASMLIMISELGGRADGTLAMSAYIIVAQLTMIPVGFLVGRYSSGRARKPIFLIAFLVLPLRGILFALTSNPYALATIQILDGIGGGIFGVMQVIVIADLTRGSGRFNLAQGAIATAVGIGAALSQVFGGVISQFAGFPIAFVTMAAIAAAALAAFWLKMPETHAHSPRKALAHA